MDWRFYGPDAVLIRFAERLGDETFQRSRAIVAELERHPPPGLIEFVPAFTTILIEFDPLVLPEIAAEMPGLLRRIERAAQHRLPPAKLHEIPVRYDGEDLERVAEARELSIDDVCALHSSPTYHVYFLGFAPGFPYLGDLDPRLHSPRLPAPRPKVAAGSVAIGGEHTGIYSVETPGGWNIIGHTSAVLFDRAADDSEAFLLRPGDRVRFVPQSGKVV